MWLLLSVISSSLDRITKIITLIESHILECCILDFNPEKIHSFSEVDLRSDDTCKKLYANNRMLVNASFWHGLTAGLTFTVRN